MGFLTGIPCAEDVEKKITDFAVGALFRGLKYMFCYKSLVKDFDTKIEKLNNEKEKISRRVKEELDNGKFINKDVLTWQKDVEDIQKKDKELSPSFRCIQCLPIPNPVSRLRLGREAVKKSEIVTVLTASGKELSDKDKDIAYLPGRSEDVPNTNTTVFQDFPSRQEAYGKLWNQLVSEDSLILGIYGMPGVGKTRMMEQIWQEAQEKKIFNKVTLAVVGSVTFDVIKLQDQLASYLNCNLESKDDKKKRADQLKSSMMNTGKILVIFDDVWGEISLSDIIGISFQDGNSWKGCKILFTSREKSHCLNNKCKDPVEITTLQAEEALEMFKNTLGSDQVDSLLDESLVQQVCTKCAGLPLIIHAVGKALKLKTASLWKDALTQLENCKIESVVGIDQRVYACLKLSFDNLPDDAKQCLLLCSLLPADTFIYIHKLVDLAAGSQLVHGGRIKVRAMVDTLRSASLLLEGQDEHNFRLHDIIRDVARSIAVKEHAFFIERCGRGLPGNAADYSTGKVWHLELEKDDFNFPPDLVCPDLHSIWLVAAYRTQQKQRSKINIPKFPVDMFLNLRFLVLERLYWQPQLSLQHLNKLKTLLVAACNLVHTDVTRFPKSLETLYIWGCGLPTRLDFAKLKNLQKLDVHGINDLQMVPNTISSLSCLEELHLRTSSGDDSTRISMPKLNEISELTCLTSLVIHWRDFEPYQDMSILCKLDKFDIRVGVFDIKQKPVPGVLAMKRIELSGKLQFEGFQNLVERAVIVVLLNTNVNISRIWNSNREAFVDLSILCIEDCDTIEYLASISLYEIQFIPRHRSSFSNLTSLAIKNCCAMKYLFNNFAAECLVQLEELCIANCDRMEVIVMNEGKSDGDLIQFPRLKLLELLSLSKLKTFYGEKYDMHSSSTSIIDNSVVHSVQQPQPLFDGMVAFPSLEVLRISSLDDTVSEIWGKKYYTNDNVSSSFRKLKSLKVSFCSGLKNVFLHSSMAIDLTLHLEKMYIHYCDLMREIIGIGEQEEITDDGINVFPVLKNLKLVGLPNLSSLWCCRNGEAKTYKVKFPVLVKLKFKDLKIDLEEIELGRDDFPCQLKYLNLSCDREIQLSSAWQLRLYDLESLTLGQCFSYVLRSLCFFKRLMVLKVTELDCSTLFSLSVLVSLQQLQELIILDCSLLEKIVEDARDDEASGMVKNTITLFHLRLVILKNLPKLKSFIHSTAECDLHMPALKRVEAVKCGVSTLFTCSFIQKLQLLEVLRVHQCNSLEGIVADERGSEASDTNDKIITLSKLSSVNLKHLPNLKSFSLATSYAFIMPKLRHFILQECPNLEYFTSSKTSTGLVKVYSEWHEGEEVPDLNNYIRRYHKIRDSPIHQPLKLSFLFLCLVLPLGLLIQFMLLNLYR